MKKEKFKLRLQRSRLVAFVHMLSWYHHLIPVWDCFDSEDDKDIIIFLFEVANKDAAFFSHFVSAWEAS